MYKMTLNIAHEVYLKREDIIKALELEQKAFLRGSDDIIYVDGKMMHVYYGTGSHHYSHDQYGSEATEQQVKYLEHLKQMINLLKNKEKFLKGEEI